MVDYGHGRLFADPPTEPREDRYGRPSESLFEVRGREDRRNGQQTGIFAANPDDFARRDRAMNQDRLSATAGDRDPRFPADSGGRGYSEERGGYDRPLVYRRDVYEQRPEDFLSRQERKF